MGTLGRRSVSAKIGAIGDADGSLHPTLAGLLMFGNHQDILCEYPDYAITYREQLDVKGNWEETPWNGNVYEFYYWAYNKLQQDVKTPFLLETVIGWTIHPSAKSCVRCWPTALSTRTIMAAAALLSARAIRKSRSPTPAASVYLWTPPKMAAYLTRETPQWPGCFARRCRRIYRRRHP